MTDPVCDTLFYPYESGALPWPEAGQRAAFFHAQPCRFLRSIPAALTLQSCHQSRAGELERQGFTVFPDLADGVFDTVLVLVPKQVQEARHAVARAVSVLGEGGVLVCAAANDAGGARLSAMLAEAGFSDVSVLSKHKGRVAFAQKTPGLDAQVLQAWQAQGAQQKICGGQYVSQPGIFCWDRVDDGSQILAEHLPRDFKGTGADFGCGYGFLSAVLLHKNPDIRVLFCIDDDWRAVQACRENTAAWATQTDVRYLWQDLSRREGGPVNLDWVVMNPPFHRGRHTDISLGVSMIEKAQGSLKRKGRLWMVANAGLPYEAVLRERFYACDKVFEGRGYKIYCAEK